MFGNEVARSPGRLLGLICGFVIVASLFAGGAAAHEVRPSIATLSLPGNGTFELKMATNIEAMLAEIGPEHEDTDDAPTAVLYQQLRALPAAELEKRFRTFTPGWLENLGLEFDGKAASMSIASIAIPETGDLDLARDSSVVLSGKVPEGAETLIWAYPAEYGASVLRVERPGEPVQGQYFIAGARSEAIALAKAEPRSTWQVFYDYVVIGFTHILPKGLDHILFVLGIFLLSPRWKPLLTQVTAFTIAHSVTLALGLYGIVNIAPSIVEPLIALSIVYVALENTFTRKLHAWRPVIVFAFGLLHGLGFAGVLREIGLEQGQFALGLVAFNVGVELGQLAVIALAFLAVGLFLQRSWYRNRIVIPASFAIAAMGAYWVVERTLA